MTDTYKPKISPRVRTVVYFTALVTGAVLFTAAGLAPIWLAPLFATKITASCAVVGSVISAVCGGLGVAYRPTAQRYPTWDNDGK